MLTNENHKRKRERRKKRKKKEKQRHLVTTIGKFFLTETLVPKNAKKRNVLKKKRQENVRLEVE
jgi:hypothetical protein